MKTLKLLFIFSLLISPHLHAQDYLVYVTSGSGAASSVKTFASDGTFMGNFVDPGAGGLNWPQDIIFLEAMDKAIVSGLNNGAIGSYDKNNGAYINDFASVPLGPTRMKIGFDGFIYVLQWSGNGKVLRYQTDGTFVDEFTSIGVNGAIGMAWDNTGNLYVSSYASNTVRKFDTAGNDLGIFISGLQGPTNCWFDTNGSGDMLVCNWNGNNIKRYDSNGTYLSDFVASITQPEGVVYLPNGNLLVGSGGAIDSIIEFQGNGTLVGVFASGNGLANPNSVVLRDPPLSISENQVNTFFVTPTVGTIFNFNTSVTDEYRSLDIYDIYGKHLETLVLSDLNATWDASKYSDGFYYLVAEKNTKRAIQKIIISKK
nr:hypothetical protein [uncultured bacterium]